MGATQLQHTRTMLPKQSTEVTLPTPKEFGEILERIRQGQRPENEDCARKYIAAIAICEEIAKAEPDSETSGDSESFSSSDLWAVVTAKFSKFFKARQEREEKRREENI